MKLWTNGYFHTLKDEHDVHVQMATDNGYIVGFDDEIKDLSFDEIIDLKQHHIYPGFVDSHLHIVGYGQKLNLVDVGDYHDQEKLLFLIKEKVIKDITFFEGYLNIGIHKNQLNQITNNKPIILRHKDYHSITVNDYVLKELNLKSETGYLTEDEAKLVLKHYQKVSDQDVNHMIETAIKSLYQFGITGGHSDDLFYFNGYQKTLDAFLDVLKKYPFRAHLLMHYKIIDDYKQSKHPFLDQNPYLQLGAVKIFYDGTLSSKTALLYHNYKNEQQHGLRMFEEKELETLIKKMRSYDLPLAIHIIGDQGLEEVVDLLKKYPPKSGLHDRIIHASLANQKTILKMVGMPIIIDIQPQFITSDLPQVLDLFSERPEYIYPFKTFLNNEIIICGSSDAPVEVPNPFLGMHAAIFRRLNDDSLFNQEETLTPYEALKLYTTYANIPTYKAHERGLLKKGYIADLKILSKDIFKFNEKDYLENFVEMTVVDEKIVYKK